MLVQHKEPPPIYTILSSQATPIPITNSPFSPNSIPHPTIFLSFISNPTQVLGRFRSVLNSYCTLMIIILFSAGFKGLQPDRSQGDDELRPEHQEEGTQALRSLCTPRLWAANEASI